MRFVCLLLFGVIPAIGFAETSSNATFARVVLPFLRTYCLDCHSPDSREGDLDLSGDTDRAAVVRNFRHWMVVRDRLIAADMPPEDASPTPDADQRAAVLAWIDQVRKSEAGRTAGDPGIVTARRLSNAEYDATIEDLTGHPIRPAAAFPIDPTNEAGFDNSGDSLTMSPTLLKKYLQATQFIAEHLVLTPTGLDFAPHPVITDTDRDKYCVNRIIDFYQQQRTDHADYFHVLWQTSLAGDANDKAKRERHATEAGLSVRYTETLWQLLTSPRHNAGPIAVLRSMWEELPSDTPENVDEQIDAMARYVAEVRSSLTQDVTNLHPPEINPGSQPLILWKNRQLVANRQRYLGDYDAEKYGSDDEPDNGDLEASLAEFCRVFPDTFFVSERARMYLDAADEAKAGRSGRLLSAGFHSQVGYFRDDGPLYDLMLSDQQRQTLDKLWLEFDFVTSAPMRQYSGFIWFDRTDSAFLRDREFDGYRAEDKDNVIETKLRGLQKAYAAKAKRVGADDVSIAAIHEYFDEMSTRFRMLEHLHADAQARHVAGLVELAQRAYRRPLDDRDRQDVVAFYNELRQNDGLDHETAVRDSVVRILMSPRFCYRVDRWAGDEDEATDAEIEQLDPYSLANRLSYFLWSSLPDDELMAAAESGRLNDPVEIVSQTQRMMRDARVQRLVTNFVGNWLDVRYFQQHNGVDRQRFTDFDDDLRQAMYEEPIRFVNDLIDRNGSILELVDADHTFVNAALAEHYGIDGSFAADQWQRIDGASRYGRGGLLPMAVFLTHSSPGLRTSPVKRGNWVVKRIFGEHVPAPPASVPELPEDESNMGELTLREALAKHREHVACAGCHERIDSFGLVFENYGPIGEWRETDLGGRTVDSSVVFPDDSQGRGLDGLRDYLHRQRRDDFVANFCRKLLAYALGRPLQLSDDPAIESMVDQLESSGYRIGGLFDQIVTSPAFLNRRTRLATP